MPGWFRKKLTLTANQLSCAIVSFNWTQIWSYGICLNSARPTSVPSPLGSLWPFWEDNEIHCPGPSQGRTWCPNCWQCCRETLSLSSFRDRTWLPCSRYTLIPHWSYKGLAISTQPRSTVKGHFYVRAPCAVSWGCHWTSMQLSLALCSTFLPLLLRCASQVLSLISSLHINCISESAS